MREKKKKQEVTKVVIKGERKMYVCCGLTCERLFNLIATEIRGRYSPFKKITKRLDFQPRDKITLQKATCNLYLY